MWIRQPDVTLSTAAIAGQLVSVYRLAQGAAQLCCRNPHISRVMLEL